MVERRARSANGRLDRQRQDHVKGLSDFDSEKVRRHHTNDRARHAFHRQRCPDNVGCSAEAPLPQSVTDDGHQTIPAATPDIITVVKRSADQRRQAQRGQELSAGKESFSRLPLTSGRQIDPAGRPGKATIECFKVHAHPVPHVVVHARARLEAMIERETGRNGHQAIGFGDGQRTKQQRVDDAEDGCIRADTESQRQHSCGRDDWRIAKPAKCQANIVYCAHMRAYTSSLVQLSNAPSLQLRRDRLERRTPNAERRTPNAERVNSPPCSSV